MRGVNTVGHTGSSGPKSNITTNPKRRASPDTLHAVAGAISREHDALDPADPRRRPTLPTLRFMRDPDPISEIGGAP
jgi:hypothetical protein